MKNYKQLMRELPSKKVVFAFGRFQPPGKNHGLVFAAVKHLASAQGADHIIYASRSQDKKSNPLPVDRKVYWLNRMFPKTNFVGADDSIRTFIEAAKHLNKKYKNLVMVAGSDRVADFQTLLDKYNGKEFNFDTIEVVSAGERDPDSEGTSGMSGTKMRDAAKNSDAKSFKRGLPSTVTTIDAKRLMNELREHMGLEVVKEDISFDRNELREQYLRGEVFLKGEFVQDDAGTYEIVDRGTNYLTVVNESGELLKKWIHMVHTVEVIAEDIPIGYAPKEITFKGYTTKNLHHSTDATKAFQATIEKLDKGLVKDPVAVLNALKSTDTYMKLNDVHLAQGKSPDETELASWNAAHAKAKDSLERTGEYLHHMDYWKQHENELQGMLANYTPATAGADMNDSYNPSGDTISEMKFNSSDKIKVARVIATALGITDVDKMSNPAQLVNNGLRKIRNKPMRPEYVDVIHHMLQTATEAGIEFDPKLVPNKVTAVTSDEVVESAAHKLVATKLKNIQSLKDFSANTVRPKVQTFIAREFQKDKKEVAEGKCGEGKCGASKKKMKEEVEEIDEGSFKYHMDKAIAAHDRNDTKKKEYHLGNANSARHALPSSEYAKHKDLFAKYKQMTEEVEEIDELSKSTLGAYTKKAAVSLAVSGMKAGRGDTTADHAQTVTKRIKGINRATDKLTSEEVEIDESTPSWVTDNLPAGKSWRNDSSLSQGVEWALKQNRGYGKPSDQRIAKMKSDRDAEANRNAAILASGKSLPLTKKVKKATRRNDELTATKFRNEEVDLEEDAKQTHMVTVTVSNPNHTMVGQRKETIMKKATVKATDENSARERVKQHYTKAGYKVHDVIHGGLKEDIGHVGMTDQEQKLATLNPNAEVKTDLPATTTKAKAKKKLSDFTADKKDNDSDMDAEVAATAEPEAVMGMHMVSPYGSHTLRRMKINYATHSEAFDPFFNDGTKNNIIDEEDELDLDDAELDKMAKEVNHEDDILDAYDDHELGIVDDETGEEVEQDVKEELETMNEVLSRSERLKAKVRFARSASKRARKTKLALKSRSSAKTLNSRARKLAVNLLKKRIARKPLDKLTLGEKERIEKIISKKKVLVNRLAMRLVSRVKKIETDRLSHKKYTK
jgi:uncharacterized low-complexity protein